MAIGDLLYEKVIDFSTNPSVPLITFGSGLSYAYEPTSKTLQATLGAADAGLIFSGEPSCGWHDGELELELKMVADSQGRKHFGGWLMSASGAVPTGYRLGGLDNDVQLTRWNAGSATVISVVANPSGGFALNQKYTFKLTKVGSLLSIFVDGVLKASVTDAAYFDLRPGLFLWGCTVQLSRLTWRHKVSFIDEPPFKTVPLTAIPANQEPRSQFQPQDVAWRGVPGFVYPGPMPSPPAIGKQICKGLDLAWVRDGVQNVLQGYIESTVTISGEGVRRRVLCFDQAGNLVGETWSRASDGKYRFDLLWLNRRYMLVAQDDPVFGPADYNAVAADYQQPTPYAPGQGVGLA